MHKNKLIFIALLLLSAILFLPFTPRVRAQENIKFDALEIDLWPEYDQPEMLVIYRIILSSEVTLPTDLSLRIPSEVGDPNAVAVRQADGVLISVPYTRQVSGEWATISFSSTMPEIQFEYYDPNLNIDGSQRHFEYHWSGDYTVDALSIQVQQPVDSDNFRISPGTDQSSKGSDGLIYFTKQVGAFSAGETFKLSIDYQKDSSSLTAEKLNVVPSVPVEQTGSFQTRLLTYLPWFLGALGVVLLVGGAWWYWQSGQQKRSSRTSPRGQRRRSISPQLDHSEEHIYCHQCGKRASSGDRFCRTCGNQLRKE